MTFAHTRQRKRSETDSHEVYFAGEYVAGNLSEKEAQRQARALRRRQAKREHRFR